MGALDYKTRRHRRNRLAAEMAVTYHPRKHFRLGQDIGWHWQLDDPNLLYRRRNRLTYTGGSYASPWAADNSGATNPTVTANYAAAPDGTMTAARVQLNKTGGVFSRLRYVVSYPTGRQYVVSVYARTTSGSGTANVGLRGADAGGTNMAVSGTWQRFTYALGTITTPADFQILLWDSIAGNDETADILIWGAQLELGSSATEYQPVPTTWAQAYLDAVGAERIYAWTDTAGTIPNTAIGEGIGLLLGREYGGARGVNSWNPGAVSLAGESSQVSSGVYRIYSSAGALSYVAGGTTVVGRLYEVQFTIDSITTPGAGIVVGDSGATFTTTGRKTSVWLANLTFAFIKRNAGATDVQISNISIREIPGTHLTQATGTARPTLSARVNAFVSSEDPTNANWTKTELTASSGGLLTGSVNTGVVRRIVQGIVTGTASYKLTWRVKMGTQRYVQIYMPNDATPCFNYDLQAGTVTTIGGSGAFITAAPDGYYDIGMTYAGAGGTAQMGTLQFVDSLAAARNATHSTGSTTLYLARADLRTADDAAKNIPAYQLVGATAADHDTDGFPHYAEGDGTDNCWASVATVDGSAHNKISIVTAVTKNSDAAIGLVIEHTANTGALDGSFYVGSPAVPAAAHFAFATRGTVQAAVRYATTYAAPITGVLTSAYDNSASGTANQNVPLVNGATPGAVSDVLGPTTAANFANATLYVLSRAGSSLRFNGRFYGSTGRFGSMSDSERNNLTRWWQKRIGTA